MPGQQVVAFGDLVVRDTGEGVGEPGVWIDAVVTPGVRLVGHGGRGLRLTVVFRADLDKTCILVSLVPFGGQVRMPEGETRKSISG